MPTSQQIALIYIYALLGSMARLLALALCVSYPSHGRRAKPISMHLRPLLLAWDMSLRSKHEVRRSATVGVRRWWVGIISNIIGRPKGMNTCFMITILMNSDWIICVAGPLKKGLAIVTPDAVHVTPHSQRLCLVRREQSGRQT